MGAGVTDHKGVFGTTLKAKEQFPDRVIETPLSEQMLTGACVGLAQNGYTPIFVHARMDFMSLSVEHLVNTAAKLNFMGEKIPMMVRCIIGQGFGNGPQHTQNFAHWFANVPGLDVHMPVGRDGIRAAFASLADGNTVVMVEHRRLYETELHFGFAHSPNTTDVNLYAFSAATIDADRAAILLEARADLNVNVWPIEHLNHRWFKHGWEQGGMNIVLDIGPQAYGPSAQFAANLYEGGATQVRRISPPHTPCPASYPLEQAWYPTPEHIANVALEMLGRKPAFEERTSEFVPAGGPF